MKGLDRCRPLLAIKIGLEPAWRRIKKRSASKPMSEQPGQEDRPERARAEAEDEHEKGAGCRNSSILVQLFEPQGLFQRRTFLGAIGRNHRARPPRPLSLEVDQCRILPIQVSFHDAHLSRNTPIKSIAEQSTTTDNILRFVFQLKVLFKNSVYRKTRVFG